MTHDRLGLEELLTEAENAAPVDSIDVIAAGLRERSGATAVSFLFLDLVGQQMVRKVRGHGRVVPVPRPRRPADGAQGPRRRGVAHPAADPGAL
ncbi:hypothetical protein AB0G05_40080 [Nonomuraea wenchangensis]